MKLRTYELDQRAEQPVGKNWYIQPGSYALLDVGESHTEVLTAGLDYTSAQSWAFLLEEARDSFIEDNQQTCTSCKARWIILDNLPALFCPRCKETQHAIC